MSDAPLYSLTYRKQSLIPTAYQKKTNRTYYVCYLNNGGNNNVGENQTKLLVWPGSQFRQAINVLMIPFFVNDDYVLILHIKGIGLSHVSNACVVDEVTIVFYEGNTIKVFIGPQQLTTLNVDISKQNITSHSSIKAKLIARLLNSEKRGTIAPDQNIEWELYKSFQGKYLSPKTATALFDIPAELEKQTGYSASPQMHKPLHKQVKSHEFIPPLFTLIPDTYKYRSDSLHIIDYNAPSNSNTLHTIPMSMVLQHYNSESNITRTYMFSDLFIGFLFQMVITLTFPERFSTYVEHFFTLTVNSQSTIISVADESTYNSIKNSSMHNNSLSLLFDSKLNGAEIHLKIMNNNHQFIIPNIVIVNKPKYLKSLLTSEMKTKKLDNTFINISPMDVTYFKKIDVKYHNVNNKLYYDCGENIVFEFSYVSFSRDKQNVLMVVWDKMNVIAYDTFVVDVDEIILQTLITRDTVSAYVVNNISKLVHLKVGNYQQCLVYHDQKLVVLRNMSDFFGDDIMYRNALVYLKIRESVRFFTVNEHSFYEKLRIYDKQFKDYFRSTFTASLPNSLLYDNEFINVSLKNSTLQFKDKQLKKSNSYIIDTIKWKEQKQTKIYYASFNGEAKFHSVIMLDIEDIGTYVCVFENDTKIYGGRRKAVIIE